jgi:hypothetical protein
MRARRGAAAWIANHPGEIADDENSLVTEILKLAQLAQNDGVTQMNIGRRWIDTEFHAKRPAERELFAKLRFADDLRSAFL